MFDDIYNEMKKSLKNKDIIKKNILKTIISDSRALAKAQHIKTPTDEMIITAIENEMEKLKFSIEIVELSMNKEKYINSKFYLNTNMEISILNKYLNP